MLNQVNLIGRLGADPEVRTMTGGSKVANLRIATDAYSGGKKYTEWHRVEAFGDKLVELIEARLAKGDLVAVSNASIRTKKFTRDGVDHYTTSIVAGQNAQVRFLQTKSQDAEERQADEAPQPGA